MPDVFLSYSRDDQVAAQRFASGFEREGIGVWWDQTLHSGENYDQVTERALREARAVVVLWSKKSVESRWVRAEATQADRLGTLMPAMIEPCTRPIMFELKHTAELAHWKGEANDPAWRAFVADVRRTTQVHQQSSAAPAAASAAPAAPARWRWAAIAVLAALLLSGGLYWMNSTQGTGATATAGASAGATRDAATPVTLAVLPFADLSQAQDQEYFSDGLAEEILNQLAQVPDLAVTGRTSSFSFKGRNEDLRVIAQKLGVANLLEGSVRKSGDELRITAQLIDGTNGAHRWSKTYARELRDVFTVQEEIARDVARALSVTLDVGETSRAKGGTTDLAAYEVYLKARKLFLEGGHVSALQAAELLREAVRLDPQFVRAWEALAQASVLAALRSSPAEIRRLEKQRDDALERIRMLDPDGGATQAARISAFVGQRRWAEAVAAAESLMSSKSLSAEDLLQGGEMLGVLLAVGRVNEAIRLVRQYMQREPLSMLASTDLARMLYITGQYDEALAENERSKGLSGDWSRPRGRALLLALRQEPIDAQAVRALVADTNRDEGLMLKSTTSFGELGSDRKAMLDLLRREFEGSRDHTGTEMSLFMQIADALGDKDLTLAALEGMIDRTQTILPIWLAPNSGIRSDPRFKALVRESGLVDYWRESGNWGDFCRPVGDEDFECR